MIQQAWGEQQEIRTVMLFYHPMESAPPAPPKCASNREQGHLRRSGKSLFSLT